MYVFRFFFLIKKECLNYYYKFGYDGQIDLLLQNKGLNWQKVNLRN